MSTRSSYWRQTARHRRGTWVISGLLLLLILGLSFDYAVSLHDVNRVSASLIVMQELAGPNSSFIGKFRQGGSTSAQPSWELAEDETPAPAVKSGGTILITGGGGNIGQPECLGTSSHHRMTRLTQ